MKGQPTGIIRNPGEGWDKVGSGIGKVAEGIKKKDTVLIIHGAAEIVIGILA